MKFEEFLNIIEEIGIALGFKDYVNSQAVLFFRQFIEYNSNQQYQKEVVICSSYLVASKIYDIEIKLRDIINVVFIIKELYKQQCPQQSYTDITHYQKFQQFYPQFSLEFYQKLKQEILNTEQYLLRIISFKFNHQTMKIYQKFHLFIQRVELVKVNENHFLEKLFNLSYKIFQDSFKLIKNALIYPQIFKENDYQLLIIGSIYVTVLLIELVMPHKLRKELLDCMYWAKTYNISNQQLIIFSIDILSQIQF